ncbi:DUF2207 domain-containing protein [Anaerobium acetethylicum]|uniref:Predicted membrane protein n=1 Tax=Anaerobium acetethylicum TaxID=1619234 RepID=A0A1D3TS17_9FIRM|nr:DUF2207 domain-containing protein [Anaerobium acetethylicum]SCP96553.1 Predicted membrane protein [Anaerobium acetethylicum]
MKKRIRYFIILIAIFSMLPYFDSSASGPRSEYMLRSTADTDYETGSISTDSAYGYYEYVLDSYDVNIFVNEDNTFYITENIEAYFNIPKHGIYRKIPLKNEVVRLDGTISHNRAKISSINVNEAYTASNADGHKVIKIGNPDSTLTGPVNYIISYLYNIGKDTGKEYDELYLDIIGDEWDTAIGKVTFMITMPKEFDSEKLGFSRGATGSTDSSGIAYEVQGNVIRGSYNGVLQPGEGLTVRLELPEGYFKGAGTNVDLLMILSIVLPILFLLITGGMWFVFGRDNRVVETVEFYPPEGFNSAETGFLYKGKADQNDAVSLLIYLANKGYMKISEVEENSLFVKKKNFKLTKLKEYDGTNENERIFLSGLFNTPKKMNLADITGMIRKTVFKRPEDAYDMNGSNYRNDYGTFYETGGTEVEEVNGSDLYNSFYVTLDRIVANLNQKENRQTIFEKSSLGKGLLVGLMIIAVFILITVRPVVEFGGAGTLPFALIFPGIGFSVLAGMVFGKTPIPVKLFGLVWGLGFGGMPWGFLVLPALMADSMYLIAYVSGLVCIFLMVLLLKAMPKRTVYGNQLLGKIRGFRNFLETAEKPRLEALVMENPSYFYDILPYTYVLGVSDKWIRKFETIAMRAPDWYSGRDAFTMAAFGAFMGTTMKSASEAMSSRPSSSGSGSSSGGGSSGGGSGGGGGGSW